MGYHMKHCTKRVMIMVILYLIVSISWMHFVNYLRFVKVVDSLVLNSSYALYPG